MPTYWAEPLLAVHVLYISTNGQKGASSTEGFRLIAVVQPGEERRKRHGQQGGAEEDANETPGQQAADDADHDQQKRQGTREPDKVGLDEIVHDVDGQAPDDGEYRPAILALMRQPGGGWNPDYRGADLHHGDQEAQQSQNGGGGYSGQGEADARQRRDGSQ